MRLVRAGKQRANRGRVDLFRLQPPAAGGGGASYLLDTYPALAAYSTRQLSSTATNCIRVREGLGSTEADIGFSGGWVDEAAIAAHCNGQVGFVVTWYDQAGSYDMTQATITEQPQIYDGATVFQENGKPKMLQLAGGNQKLFNSSFPSTAQPYTVFTVNNMQAGASNEYSWEAGGFGPYAYFSSDGSWIVEAGSQINDVTPKTASQHVTYTLFNGASSDTWVDGVSTTGNPGTNSIGTTCRLGNDSTADAIAGMQEYIFFSSDQSSNASAIESDINTAFSVYA